MPYAAHIQEMARQVRGGTLRVLDSCHESWLLWCPGGTNNHILWHAGHALWLGDVLGVALLTGHSELPEGWAATFGQDCRPVAETKVWPSRAEVRELLVSQLERLVNLLDRATGDDLDRPTSRGGPSIARSIIHGLHDEAIHQGEMKLIVKLCRAGWCGP